MARAEWSPVKTKKKKHVTIGADIHLSWQAKTGLVAAGLATLWVLSGGHLPHGDPQAGAPAPTSSSNPHPGIPDALLPGVHPLPIDTGMDIGTSDFSLIRQYGPNNTPTDRWSGTFKQTPHTFINGVPFPNPLEPGYCELFNAGVDLSAKKPPTIVCELPQAKKHAKNTAVIRHHGVEQPQPAQLASVVRFDAPQRPRAYHARRAT